MLTQVIASLKPVVLMFAMLNGTSLVGALAGPVVFGLTADFAGLRCAMALMAIAAILWMSGLVQAVRDRPSEGQ